MKTSKLISIALLISMLLSVTVFLQGCKKKESEHPAGEHPTAKQVEEEAKEQAAEKADEHPTEHPSEHPSEHPQ